MSYQESSKYLAQVKPSSASSRQISVLKQHPSKVEGMWPAFQALDQLIISEWPLSKHLSRYTRKVVIFSNGITAGGWDRLPQVPCPRVGWWWLCCPSLCRAELWPYLAMEEPFHLSLHPIDHKSCPTPQKRLGMAKWHTDLIVSPPNYCLVLCLHLGASTHYSAWWIGVCDMQQEMCDAQSVTPILGGKYTGHTTDIFTSHNWIVIALYKDIL